MTTTSLSSFPEQKSVCLDKKAIRNSACHNIYTHIRTYKIVQCLSLIWVCACVTMMTFVNFYLFGWQQTVSSLSIQQNSVQIENNNLPFMNWNQMETTTTTHTHKQVWITRLCHCIGYRNHFVVQIKCILISVSHSISLSPSLAHTLTFIPWVNQFFFFFFSHIHTSLPSFLSLLIHLYSGFHCAGPFILNSPLVQSITIEITDKTRAYLHYGLLALYHFEIVGFIIFG